MKIKWRKITTKKISWSKLRFYNIGGSVDCISYFNGTTAYAVSTSRIIDLDAVDKRFHLKWWGNFGGSGTHFSQNISNSTAREFQIYTLTDLIIILGGTTRSLLTDVVGSGYGGYGFLEIEYDPILSEIYIRKNGILLNTTVAVTIGVTREPTAKFKYMARSNNSIDSQAFFKEGFSKAVEIITSIKHVILPMDECDKELDGTIIYKDRGAGGFDAVGYNIDVQTKNSAWYDANPWFDNEPWFD